jgi:hypothetical protein
MKGAPGGSFDGTAHGEQAPLHDFLCVGVVAKNGVVASISKRLTPITCNDIGKIPL